MCSGGEFHNSASTVERSYNVGTPQEVRRLHRQGRAHNVFLINNKEIDIRGMELDATTLQAINWSIEVNVGGKPEDIDNLGPIHDRLCWKKN